MRERIALPVFKEMTRTFVRLADPGQGLGFAFIPSAMHSGALPGPRTQKLVAALSGVVVS